MFKAVRLTPPKLHGGVLPDTVMTHARVSAHASIVEMLLVAAFAVPLGTLPHCMTSCSTCDDLRRQWCAALGVHVRDATQWSSLAWVFDPSHSFNTPRTLRAHAVFVARVCARVLCARCEDVSPS